IRLDSVEVLQHQLNNVRGPYSILDQELTIGSKRVLIPDPPEIPDSQRLIASAIGGDLTLDSVAILNEVPSYHLIATIASGRLEEYARRYLPGARNLHGVINGWIDLHGGGDAGRGAVTGDDVDSISGKGQLQISPAALYELPVLVQVFRVLSFVPTDRTAFTYALLDFTVDRGAFWFKTIDLVGDTISMRGKGQARFDGKLALDFYSMLGRNRPRIPVFNILVDEATRGWVGVEVGGTVSAPQARTKALPTIDETLRRFLGAFDTVRRPPIPRVRRAPAPPRLPSL
ncbi:MAG: AsmA-like C-terminal region-containing protein, partial [Planctomycetaceae bacterium]